ncbi:hypothetical protein SAMN05660841_04108 [Sphingobacterium nematocida]|uniref:Uncharacterized protein n=1 Tax=Sphingobacterium nematocida TaxID=1513896 RepID=A0A1T5GIS8_9SPHI|nr:hypothetical protein SAMN05660841_04108 [Sphingobacterium nematocida]
MKKYYIISKAHSLNEQLDRHKQYEFTTSRKYITNISWFSSINRMYLLMDINERNINFDILYSFRRMFYIQLPILYIFGNTHIADLYFQCKLLK